MNERVKDGQDQLSVRRSGDSQWPSLIGNSIRIDGPHTSANQSIAIKIPTMESEADTIDDRFLSLPDAVPQSGSHQSVGFDASELPGVSQLAQRLQQQIQSELTDLVHRENALRDLQAAFQEERQRFLRAISTERADLDARRIEQDSVESAFVQQSVELELRTRELETGRETLLRQQVELQQRNQSLHQEVLAGLNSERVELDRTKLSLQEEANRLQLLNETLEKTRDELAAENVRTLQTERENLWKSLTTEWEQRNETFQQEKESSLSAFSLEKSEFDREKAQFEASVQSANAEFLAAREALSFELTRMRQQHAEALHAERSEWLTDFEQQKQTLSIQQAELARERTLIENRIRFQQEHLDKSRADFERAQNDYRRERQVELNRLEEAGMLLVLRLRQLDLYRSSIDEREKSLDREYEAFHRTQQTLGSTAELERLNLQSEREAWEQERAIQQAEVRRQLDTLAERSEGMESRRARLDKLRAELEETHRATLEMRLAVEEAWAQLTGVASQEEARQRVEQVRLSLTGYYQQMHETLQVQRREVLEAQTKFERQQHEFVHERQKLTAWFEARDEELRQGEERLRQSGVESSTNNANWLAARDRWLIEKTEAEQLIRRLLTSLGETNRTQFLDIETALPQP